MYNLANQARAAIPAKNNGEQAKKRTRMPGISDCSKRIKKEKKKTEEANKKPVKADEESKQQNAAKPDKAEGSEKEEGEEGMLSEVDVSSGGEDSELNDRPPSMKLLDKHDKYVEYIDVLIEKPGTFYEYTAAFSQSSKYAIKEILTAKSKEEISLAAFPLRLRIFLVPGLNVLTVQVVCEKATTDQILGDLLSFEDQGSQLMIKESEIITSDTSERMYKWLHSLAGLQLDFAQS